MLYWFTYLQHSICFLQMCAWLQLKKPVVVQDSIPLRNPLYVSGVMSCHVTALTSWHNARMGILHVWRKIMYLFFFVICFHPGLSMRACMCVHCIVSCACVGRAHQQTAVLFCPLCWLLTHGFAGIMPTTTPIVPTLKRMKELSDAHTHIHLSVKPHGKSHTITL